MRRALWRQARADLSSRRLQALQLVLILTAAAITVTMGMVMQYGASGIWDHTFSAANGAHAVFLARDGRADLTPIRHVAGVTDTSGLFPVLFGYALAQDPVKPELIFEGVGVQQPRVSRPLMTAGHWLTATRPDGIVLDPEYARGAHARVGQRVAVLTRRGAVPLTVVGLALNPNWLYPHFSPLAYVRPATLAQIEPDRTRWGLLLLLLVVLLGLQAVVALFTMLPAWRGGRIGTVQTITVGAGQVHTRSSHSIGVARRLRLPLVLVLGAQDAFARPWRALLTIGGLALTVAAATATLSTDSVFQAWAADPTLVGLPPGTVTVQRGYLSDAATRHILNATRDVRSYSAMRRTRHRRPLSRRRLP